MHVLFFTLFFLAYKNIPRLIKFVVKISVHANAAQSDLHQKMSCTLPSSHTFLYYEYLISVFMALTGYLYKTGQYSAFA